MRFVIKFLASAGPSEFSQMDPRPGAYLRSYDPDAYKGLGQAVWTEDPKLAKLFPSPKDAWEAWQAQSTVRPLRDDGKPNKPLTAFSVEITQIGVLF
jgi:hypothetical protein